MKTRHMIDTDRTTKKVILKWAVRMIGSYIIMALGLKAENREVQNVSPGW